MDGHPARIDGRNARGCQHHHAFRTVLPQAAQKGCLTRASLSREEQVSLGCFYYLACKLSRLVLFDAPGFHLSNCRGRARISL